jgi:hypothetical protein
MEFGFDDGPLRPDTTVTNARAHRQCSAAPTGILATSEWTEAQ